VADVLAGEAAADEIDGNSVSSKSIGCEGADVVIDRHSWPVLRQHGAAEPVDLAEGDRAHAGLLEAEREAADAGEEIEHAHVGRLLCLL
jgi:hypothetical protein